MSGWSYRRVASAETNDRSEARAFATRLNSPGAGHRSAADARLLENKVVVDPSNPLGFDENGQVIRTLPEGQSAGSVVAALLPAGAHYVKAFGTLAADALATAADREPRSAVLFYATDDDTAATTIERLIHAAGSSR